MSNDDGGVVAMDFSGNEEEEEHQLSSGEDEEAGVAGDDVRALAERALAEEEEEEEEMNQEQRNAEAARMRKLLRPQGMFFIPCHMFDLAWPPHCCSLVFHSQGYGNVYYLMLPTRMASLECLWDVLVPRKVLTTRDI